ncbi:hypothetical protein PS914_03803 [Pseudomonas fluorescens]|nr:hypothetical protein PS914_03803 [Pseudomonas fluorescens]
MSGDLKQKLSAGDLDIALVKREPDSGPCWAAWPEDLVWVKGVDVDTANAVVPLALFPQGHTPFLHQPDHQGVSFRCALILPLFGSTNQYSLLATFTRLHSVG